MPKTKDLCHDINSNYIVDYCSYCVDSKGRLHSEKDLPATIDLNGTLTWYYHGLVHRKNKPAIVGNGYIEYYNKDLMHRTDGPASISYDDNGKISSKHYYIKGKNLSYPQFKKITKKNGNKTYLKGELHSFNDKPSFNSGHEKQWHKKGKLHRIGKPAHIFGGNIYYYVNGLLHRRNAPAVITTSYEEYYKYGLLHNLNGPAKIYISSNYSELECEYFCNGKLHRLDGPARIFRNKRLEYYQHNKLHRDDGPAIEFNNLKGFFINGVRYSEKNYWMIIKNPGILNFK